MLYACNCFVIIAFTFLLLEPIVLRVHVHDGFKTTCMYMYSQNCPHINQQLNHWLISLSVDVDFIALNGNILISLVFISAHSHLDLISGGLIEILEEPRWVVHRTACIHMPTAFAIP